MPPPGYEPFRDAICASPADNTPRLVYADWLDDHGAPDRAEFIRLQVELARAPVGHPASERIRALRVAHGAAWKDELPRIPKVDWGLFARGFVAEASFCEGAKLAENLERAFAATPVETVRFVHCRPGVLSTLVRSPVFGRVRSVVAHSGCTNDRDLEELAASLAAENLESLICGSFRQVTTAAGPRTVPMVTDRAAVALAESPHLCRLRYVRITGAGFSPAGLARLLERFGPDPWYGNPDAT